MWRINRFLWGGGAIALAAFALWGLVALLGVYRANVWPVMAAAPVESGAPASTAVSTSTVYLPLVVSKFPRTQSIYGFEVFSLTDPDVSRKAAETGAYWVRVSAFEWDTIEPTRTAPATYDWSKVDEQTLEVIASKGMRTIAMVKFAPGWAQKIPGVACGPIAEGAFGAFGEFLTAAVQKYSRAPYSIKYWELGNEPDVDNELQGSPHSNYGCWGDNSDLYYGGEYYAEMLKVAYPAIKAADPEAQVLIGGLLLDCDPTVVPPPPGKDCNAANFFEGILRNGGGSYFDLVSFHGYPSYTDGTVNDEDFEGWASRGGVVLGKIDFLREVMANYGVDKPLMHTESALICPEWNVADCASPDDTFFQRQADYVVWLYVRNWAAGVQGTIWYPFDGNGWRHSGLLGSPADPKNAYRAFDFLSEALASTTYAGPVTDYPGLRGYAFSKGDRLIWVLWSPDYQPGSVTLPAGATAVLDKYGNPVVPLTNTIIVTSPVFVELNP